MYIQWPMYHSKLLRCKLLQTIVDYCVASNCKLLYCKPLRLLQAIPWQAIANFCKLLHCKLLGPIICIASHAGQQAIEFKATAY